MATVFLSYKHESEEHTKRVRDFADALETAGQAQGVSVVLDQYFLKQNPAGPNEGWEIWSENQAAKADFILVIASRQYYEGYNLQHAAGTAPGIIPEIFIIRKRIRGEGYQPNSIRPLVLLDADKGFVPDALSHLHRFDAGDAANILAWIIGVAPAGAPVAAWLAAPPALDDWMVADCDDIRAAFAKLLVPNSPARILLIKGEGGLGKSTLTEELAASPPRFGGGPVAARLDLKSGLDIRSLLGAFARKLRLRDIDSASENRTPLDRLAALFDALEKRSQPAVLVFDTFESSGPLGEWVVTNVLPAAAGAPWLRVVVAGREVPDPDLAEAAGWRDVTGRHVLKKLKWNDWRSLAKRLRPELRDADIKKLHKFACGDHHAIRATLSAGAAA